MALVLFTKQNKKWNGTSYSHVLYIMIYYISMRIKFPSRKRTQHTRWLNARVVVDMWCVHCTVYYSSAIFMIWYGAFHLCTRENFKLIIRVYWREPIVRRSNTDRKYMYVCNENVWVRFCVRMCSTTTSFPKWKMNGNKPKCSIFNGRHWNVLQQHQQ